MKHLYFLVCALVTCNASAANKTAIQAETEQHDETNDKNPRAIRIVVKKTNTKANISRGILGVATSTDGGLALLFGEEGDYDVEITATDGEPIFAGEVHSDGVTPVFIAVDGMTEDDQFYTLF